MLIHDIIKIKYVGLGYIKKNYPYHLISDEEMFNAFIDVGDGFKSNLIDPNVRFFDMYYPNPFTVDDYYIKTKVNPDGTIQETRISLTHAYSDLKTSIQSYISAYLKHQGTSDEESYTVPNWIYTYMLGEVVYQQSEYLDIEDTLELLGCDNLENIFTKEACIECYKISSNYISSTELYTVAMSGSNVTKYRPPTVFGEPHVIKSLRMEN